MPRLLRRTLELHAGGLTVGGGLRVSASIERPADPTQSVCDVRLYNLSPGVERQVYERGGQATLVGGYTNLAGVLFDGRIQRIRRVPAPTARILAVTIGDRIQAPGQRGGVSCRSYSGPYQTRRVVADLARDVGLVPGPLDAIPAGHTLTNWAWSGETARALTEACSAAGAVWYEEDGLIRVRSRSDPTQPDAPAFVVNPNVGLIRTLTETDEGAQAHMWCNPGLRRGSRIHSGQAGQWVVASLTHQLDSWRGPFDTWADLRAAV